MVTITPENKIVTLINVFMVEPEKQQSLLDALIEADQLVKQMPGYISANFHCSLDGTKVVNYTQWESKTALNTMLRHPQASVHLQSVRQIATKFDPIYCDVVYSSQATNDASALDISEPENRDSDIYLTGAQQ